MRIFDPAFVASLGAARDTGIAPVWFVHFVARDRATGDAQPMGLWSGDDDIAINVEAPSGGVVSRTYFGGCNLSVEGIQYVADLTDQPVTVGLSQIADAAQQLVRGFDLRLGYVEVHATTWTGGALTSVPQLEYVGIVDEGPISTPAIGGDGGIALTIRSELMSMLTAINPAKSSDAHQKRRLSTDRFSEYASTVGGWSEQWYFKKD